jgi:CHAD domain-containing protein
VEAPEAVLPSTPVEQQAEHLDAWLRHAREHQAAALQKKAVKELPKFDAEAVAFEVATSQGRRSRRRPRSAAVVALESFARLVHEMHQLDAGNLHDFRKGAKKARYIAESAAEDAHALAVGKTLKKLQDEIGDWHDWLVLAEEARSALGDEGSELIALLDGERDSHYVVSMKTVERLRGKLLGEWLATTQPHRRAPSATRKKSSP